MRTTPYTVESFFTAVNGILKEKGMLPDILDYALPGWHKAEHQLKNNEFEIVSKLDYGESEGIYLDLAVRDSGCLYDLGTYKTLKDTDDAMRTMGSLLGSFMAESARIRNQNYDDFTWSGYSALGIQREKGIAGYGYGYCDIKTEERLKELLEELFAGYPDYIGAEVTDHTTKTKYLVAANGYSISDLEKLMKGENHEQTGPA